MRTATFRNLFSPINKAQTQMYSTWPTENEFNLRYPFIFCNLGMGANIASYCLSPLFRCQSLEMKDSMYVSTTDRIIH